jgi:hypothetical protein
MSLSMKRHVLLPLLLAAAVLSGCASTTLTDSWFDPAYTRGPFQKWIVVGVGGSTVASRTLEDAMTSKLRARGVEAVQGYRFLPEGRASEQQLDGAVSASGAEALMLVHLRRVENKTQVTTAMVPGPVYPGFGWYGAYGGWYAVPQVSQYQVATVETTVYQVNQKKLVWSGVTQTFDPGTVAAEAPGFSEVILSALATRGLVPVAK